MEDRVLDLETSVEWVPLYPPHPVARRVVVWATDLVELGLFRLLHPPAGSNPVGRATLAQGPSDRDPVTVPAGWALLVRRSAAATNPNVSLVASLLP